MKLKNVFSAISLSEDNVLIIPSICFWGCQAIGLLIGMEDVPLEKQSEYLAAFLNPLCEKVNVELEISCCFPSILLFVHRSS